MGIIKKFLMVVLVVVASAAALSYGARYIPDGKLDSVKKAATQIQPFVQANIQKANVGQLGELTSNVQSVTGRVLGISTIAKPDDATGSGTASGSTQVSQSIPQKTFEYARYSYCQEVVKEYESRK